MHPTLFPFETKFRVSDEPGMFTGLASTFGGEPDSYGDVIVPGAFAKSLARHQVRNTMPSLLWAHSMGEPIGVWTEMRETSVGLEVKGRLTMDVERARDRDLPRRKADLLVCLAQRRVDSRLAVRLHATAREADLACVMLEMGRAFGEEHVEAFGPLDERE